MKKLVMMLMLAGAALAANASVPGKVYAPGDTIMVDGYNALVYYVTPDGLHGRAMLPPALPEQDRKNVKKKQDKIMKKVSQKTPEELYAETEKNLAKLVKAGHMTQDAANSTLQQLKEAMEKMDADKPIGDAAMEQEPNEVVKPVKVDKKFLSRVYHIDEWKSGQPESWDLMNVDDGARIIKHLTGGLGRENQFSIQERSSLPEKFTKDPFWQSQLRMMLVSGFIVLDQNTGHINFIRDFTAKITPKHWMELTDGCDLHELTIAVTSF